MTIFTRQEALDLLIDAFPSLPLPKITDERIFYSGYDFDWLSVKDTLWTDVSKYKVESFSWFNSISGHIPAEYYFYYLPAVWVAVFNEPNFFDIIYRSLLPSHSHKTDERWRNYVSVLSSKQINTLLVFLKKCQSSIHFYENVMEIDILIEALERIK
jgi:hypothetical protein